jgi:chromosome segregation ATPase
MLTCFASALFTLLQLQTSLVEARRQLETLQQQHAQQQRQQEEAGKQLAALQAQRAAAAAEAAGAQQELQRVLNDLQKCQQVGSSQ